MYTAAQLLHRNTRSKYARWYYAMLVTAELIIVDSDTDGNKNTKLMRITVPQSIGAALMKIYHSDLRYPAYNCRVGISGK